ncbi:MAG: hypothetical protein ABSH13_16820 [Candidatus Acidiferrum sp.]|jgi:hypothetical protein
MLSTDVPYRLKAIRAHLTSGASLPMNVSREADAAFMQELKRMDPKRHARLIKNLQLAHLSALKDQYGPSGRCQNCGLVLPTDIRKDSVYCDRTCQKNAYLARKAA